MATSALPYMRLLAYVYCAVLCLRVESKPSVILLGQHGTSLWVKPTNTTSSSSGYKFASTARTPSVSTYTVSVQCSQAILRALRPGLGLGFAGPWVRARAGAGGAGAGLRGAGAWAWVWALGLGLSLGLGFSLGLQTDARGTD